MLAVNARNLYKRLDVFDDILEDNSSIEVLAWTGTGEPPISNYQVDKIHTHFKELRIEKQLGFDCQVCLNILSYFDAEQKLSLLF